MITKVYYFGKIQIEKTVREHEMKWEDEEDRYFVGIGVSMLGCCMSPILLNTLTNRQFCYKITLYSVEKLWAKSWCRGVTVNRKNMTIIGETKSERKNKTV